VNGTHASESPRLLTDIVRNEWGYEGLIVSDWFVYTPSSVFLSII
jgi:beta-glucosidase